MIIITHYDDCRATIQLVAASMMFRNETRTEYRARLLPLAQDHASKFVDFPQCMIWDRWIAEGIAYDEAQDELYQIMRLPLAMTIQRAYPELDRLRIVSEEQAAERITRWRAVGEGLRARRADRAEGRDDD